MFSVNLIQRKMDCAIRNITRTLSGGPAPALSSFLTVHASYDPKVIARFLKEFFDHRNTLMAAQSGHVCPLVSLA